MKIRQAQRLDIPVITDVYVSAFMDEKLTAWLYPQRHKYPDDFRREMLRDIKTKFYGPSYVVWVAEVEPGDQDDQRAKQVVGFAIWHRHGTSDTALKWHNDSILFQLERFLEAHITTYEDLIAPDRSAHPSHKTLLNSTPDVFAPIPSRWHLCNLATQPSFQKRGIARRLMQRGLEIAAEERVPVTLEATVDGESLYRSLGFRDYSYTIVADGIDGPALIWEPAGEEWSFGTKFPPMGLLVEKGEGRKWKPLDVYPADNGNAE